MSKAEAKDKYDEARRICEDGSDPHQIHPSSWSWIYIANGHENVSNYLFHAHLAAMFEHFFNYNLVQVGICERTHEFIHENMISTAIFSESRWRDFMVLIGH